MGQKEYVTLCNPVRQKRDWVVFFKKICPMKRITFYAALLPITYWIGCSSKAEKPTFEIHWPVLSPHEKIYNFGKVSAHEKVSHAFRFTNLGIRPLVITSINASYGCSAVVHFPKTPVAPDGEGQIDIEFDPTGKSGFVNNYVEIAFNSNPGLCKLTFTAEVLP